MVFLRNIFFFNLHTYTLPINSASAPYSSMLLLDDILFPDTAEDDVEKNVINILLISNKQKPSGEQKFHVGTWRCKSDAYERFEY